MKIVVCVLLALCVVSGGDRYDQKMVVLMALNGSNMKAKIRNDTLFVWSRSPKIDTLNIVECAEIANCSKVLFFSDKRKQVVKTTKPFKV